MGSYIKIKLFIMTFLLISAPTAVYCIEDIPIVSSVSTVVSEYGIYGSSYIFLVIILMGMLVYVLKEVPRLVSREREIFFNQIEKERQHFDKLIDRQFSFFETTNTQLMYKIGEHFKELEQNLRNKSI
jgi:hypothetical protein